MEHTRDRRRNTEVPRRLLQQRIQRTGVPGAVSFVDRRGTRETAEDERTAKSITAGYPVADSVAASDIMKDIYTIDMAIDVL